MNVINSKKLLVLLRFFRITVSPFLEYFKFLKWAISSQASCVTYALFLLLPWLIFESLFDPKISGDTFILEVGLFCTSLFAVVLDHIDYFIKKERNPKPR